MPTTPLIRVPSNITAIAKGATFPASTISKAVYDAANAALTADPDNGHRQAYAILYAETGNPAFRDNLFIATRSGTIGGTAWNANQQILEAYPLPYPKDAQGNLSIGKFSYIVGAKNLDVIKETSLGSGRYTVPSEADLHLRADSQAWRDVDRANGGNGNLIRVSPPGYLADVDLCTANVFRGGVGSLVRGLSFMMSGGMSSAQICSGIVGLLNPEAYGIITTALGKTNGQTALAGANDNGNTGKVWVGLNMYEVAADLRGKGIEFTVATVRDTIVIKDASGVIQGAWTQQMIQETSFQRALKVQSDLGLRTLEEGYQRYFNSLGGAKDALELKMPSLRNIQGYKISDASSLGEALAGLGSPDSPLLASNNSDVTYDVGDIDSPLAGTDSGFAARATAWNQTLNESFPNAALAYIPDPDRPGALIPVVVDQNGAVIGYVSINLNSREVTLQLGATDQLTATLGGKITQQNTAVEWLGALADAGLDLWGVDPSTLLQEPGVSDASYDVNSWSADGTRHNIEFFSALGQLIETASISTDQFGRTLTEIADAAGNATSSSTLQTFDDASSLEITTKANGVVINSSFDTESQHAGTITDTPAADGSITRTIDLTVDDQPVHITQYASAHDLSNGEQPGDYTTTGTITINDRGAVNAALIANVIDETYASAKDIILARGTGEFTHIVEAGDATNPNGTTASLVQVTGRPDWWNDPAVIDLASDATSLISLLRGGTPLAIATNGVNFASHVFVDPAVAQIAFALSGISNLAGLVTALEKGDLGRILIDGGGVARSALTIYSNSLQQEMISRFGSACRAGELAGNGNAAAAEIYNKGLGADSTAIDTAAANDSAWVKAA